MPVTMPGMVTPSAQNPGTPAPAVMHAPNHEPGVGADWRKETLVARAGPASVPQARLAMERIVTPPPGPSGRPTAGAHRDGSTQEVENPSREFAPDTIIDGRYRVLNVQNPFNEAQTSYFHKSIGGYHGAKLRRYQDLIERQISNNNQQVLNMLNMRYLITGDAKQPVQRNPGALGNAWFVSQVKPVANPDAEMAALSTLSPATEAVVDASKFPQQPAATYDIAGSSIALTNYSPDELKYRYNATQAGLVVFSEIYYADGWQAFIDGKPVPHIRADYVLRALQVPAGAHTIEFKFEPKSYAVGNGVSLAASIALLLVLVGTGVYVARRRERGDDELADAPVLA